MDSTDGAISAPCVSAGYWCERNEFRDRLSIVHIHYWGHHRRGLAGRTTLQGSRVGVSAGTWARVMIEVLCRLRRGCRRGSSVATTWCWSRNLELRLCDWPAWAVGCTAGVCLAVAGLLYPWHWGHRRSLYIPLATSRIQLATSVSARSSVKCRQLGVEKRVSWFDRTEYCFDAVPTLPNLLLTSEQTKLA